MLRPGAGGSPEEGAYLGSRQGSLRGIRHVQHDRGHVGPHPQEYHEEVYKWLDEATTRCRTLQNCRQALEAELRSLAEEISKPDTLLNRLVTRAP
ncbi:MAG TPA: AHH domain-containing protein [Myxococcaceae bacterium]